MKHRDGICDRRRALKLLGAATTCAGAAALVGASPASAASKSAAAYRASPNGRQRCANCSWFAPPSGCGVVRGSVNANGWCNLWG
ncbi:MAG: iron oxidase [Methylocystis sp.]|nr:MAG: iron oxidase [Methylocystis sp.]